MGFIIALFLITFFWQNQPILKILILPLKNCPSSNKMAEPLFCHFLQKLATTPTLFATSGKIKKV